MKPIKTKAQMRRELLAEMESFLAHGGAVKNIPRGVSGNTDNKNLFTYISDGPRSNPRTMLTHVVKTLDARKSGKLIPQAPKPSKPKKILIKDDFGEPLRWVWSDE